MKTCLDDRKEIGDRRGGAQTRRSASAMRLLSAFMTASLFITADARAQPQGCPGQEDCCVAHGTPGCNDFECCQAVCAIDQFCCQVAWDGICANAALQLCPDCGKKPPCPVIFSNLTPPQWEEDPVLWCRDTQPLDTVAPLNKIDYLIDQGPDQLFDIVVNYRRCTTPQDIQFLDNVSPTAEIQHIGKYIVYVALGGVDKAAIALIAARPEVAFIERQVGFEPTLNVSVPAIKVTPSSDYPTAVPQGIDGTGVNIVIMDTGVNNNHQMFAATPIIGGYDAASGLFVDPPDIVGHGTHVASIALGQGTAMLSRGVAPAAGLIDVKIFGAGTTWMTTTKTLEIVYDKRGESDWSVDVINMSIGQGSPCAPLRSDGLDAFSQLVDLAEAMGIVVVAAAGNNGGECGPPGTFLIPPILSTPAAATRAITVAASDDAVTVNRADDGMAPFSSYGPRSSDSDADDLDELKPEVCAPGVNILAADWMSPGGGTIKSGTSMSAPHVAGLAALIMQAKPGINAASVKDIMIDTAEPLAGFGPTPNQAGDPVWNYKSGWGLVDAFEAVSVAAGQDILFPSHPPNPGWLSPDLGVSPFPPQVGQLATVTANVFNAGFPVSRVKVHFGVHVFSASIPTFFDIGTRILDLPSGLTPVSIAWIPQKSEHQCLYAEIGYGNDTNYSNNVAQRNITVTQSPVTFQVRNTVSIAPQLITFDVVIADPLWSVSIDPPTVTLGADDCPVDVVVLPYPPLPYPDGASTMIHIAAQTPDGCVLGGVSILATKEDCNGNGEDDYFDILNRVSLDANLNGEPDECEAPPCPADIFPAGGDGAVNIGDLLFVIGSWGPCAGCPADIAPPGGDGVVNVADLLAVIGAWGLCP